MGGPYSTSTNPLTGLVPSGWLAPVYGKDLHVRVTLVHNGNVDISTQTVAIDPAPILNITSTLGYPTIQTAVAAATAGDIIEIQPADYIEPGQIIIDKDLTLQGKGKTMTTLRSNYNTVSSGHGNDFSAWILTEEGTDVTIKDMTIDATGFDTYTALRFQSSGLINNVAFNEIKHSASQYLGIAVQVQNGNVDVSNSMFTNIGRIGVHYRSGVLPAAVISGTYSDNMYVGKGDGDFLDYALDVSGGTTIIIQDNEISNNTGEAVSDGSTSAGILVTSFFPTPSDTSPNNVTITGNSLHDNTAGIAVGFNPMDISVVSATENNIFNNDFGITSTGPMVFAPNNYWGAADGPSGSGLGSGDFVDEEVDACPYYDAPVGSGPEQLIAPIENTTTGEFFCSIQEAIDDAETLAGHIITVPDGTFSEDITVSKGVTLQGPNAVSGCAVRAAEAIIIPATSGTTPITITSAGVTITGFTITNPAGNNAIVNSANSNMTVTNNIIAEVGINATTGNTHSIYVSSNSGAVSDITIEYNNFNAIHGGQTVPAVSNGSASAVLIGDSNSTNDVTNLSISSNCIDSVLSATVPFVSGNKGGKGAYGILLGHGGSGGGQVINAQIANNEISNLEGLWAHAIGLEGNTPSAEVLNNKIDDLVDHKAPSDAIAVMIETNNDVTDILINNNSFTNLSGGIVNLMPGTVDGTCNYWDTIDDLVIATKYFGAVTVSPFLNNGTDDSPTIGFQPMAGSCVGMFPILNVTTNVFYPNIQDAIDGAVTNDVLEIQPANYTEPDQIVVDVDVKLQGKGKVVTTLSPGMDTGASGDARAFILVNSGVDFDLADMTIDGTGRLVYQAIRQKGKGSVDNVRFTEIKYNESGPHYSGVAIAAFGNGNVDVTNCMFDEIGRIGVLYFGTGIDVSNFSNNMYTGKGVGDWLDYALDISAGAKVNVIDNMISGNRGVASVDGSGSAGLLVSTFFAGGTEATIIGNDISDNTTGIAVGFDGADVSVVSAMDNNIFGNDFGVTSTAPIVSAPNNYWGAADGPSGEGQGSGDSVSEDIIFCPWVDAPAPGGVAVSMIHNFTKDTYHCTIQEAVDAADDDDEIRVMSGLYDEQVLLNKPISLIGTGATKPILTCTGISSLPSGRKTQIEVTAINVMISGFEFDLDMSKLSSAILASGNTNNLEISNNDINPKRSGPSYAESYGLRNAISINYAGYRVNGSNPLVHISGNIISYNDGGTPVDPLDDAGFRSGVSMDEGAGTFTGNDITAINHDILSRFNGAGDLTINGSNIFRGGGVQIAEHNAGAGTITVSDNTFDSPFANTYTSSLRLQNNQQDKTTNVSDNLFNNHSWGISLENYSDITINNNTFTPIDAAIFRHITVNTKLLASNSHTIIQDEINGVFTNNTFNKALSFAGGTGIAFYNHDSDDDTIGEFIVGTSGNENSFNDGLTNFILLGDQTGDSNIDPNFPEYAALGNTMMACFDVNINIKDNLYDTGSGLKLPGIMLSSELLALEDLLYHQPDNSCLGELVFQLAEIMLTINGISAQNTNNGLVDASEDILVIACNEDDNITFSNITGSMGNLGVIINYTSSKNLTANGVDPNGTTTSATLADFNTTFIAMNQPADYRLIDVTKQGATTGVLTPFNDTNKNGTLDAGECFGEVINFEININPKPIMDSVADQLVCDGDNTNAIVFTSDVPGATFSWINNDASIGLATSGTGDIAAFTAINTGDQPVTATIIVTPNFEVDGDVCQGSSEVFIITVIDSEEPEINCPDDITMSATLGSCSANVFFESTKAYDPQYFEGFERTNFAKNTPGDWNEFNSVISRVTSGTNGITSKDGVAHGFVDNTINPQTGLFTRLGGYSSVYGDGFRTSLDVYLDLNDAAVLADTYGWDLSSAINNQTGNHRRDFIFHTSSNAMGNILIAGSNNSNFTKRNDLATLNHYEVMSSGWYTFEYIFRDAGDGSLAVDLNLRDASGTVLFTETRNTPADIIATEIGGNRYMWFTFIETDDLSIDNTTKANTLLTTCDINSGDSFSVGTTLVTCQATDGCGITDMCTFIVTVTDDEAPEFENCPVDVTVCTDDGSHSWTHPELNDNCELIGGEMTDFFYMLSGATVKDPVIVTSYDGTTMGMEIFEIGETTVTYVGVDSSGNATSNMCSFVVTVEEKPTVQATYSVPDMNLVANNENAVNEYDLTMCSGDTLIISEATLSGSTIDPSDCGELRIQTIYTNNIPEVPVIITVDLAEEEMWGPDILTYENLNSDTRTVVFVSTPYYDTNGDNMLSANERRGTDFTLTLNVDPEPVATQVSEEEACTEVMYTLTFDDYMTNILDDNDDNDDDNQPISYMWEITQISPLPIVIGVALGDMGSGNVMHTVTNPYTIVETIEYTVTPTSENGCEGESFIVNVKINANPQVAVNTNGAPELCQGEERSLLGFVVPTGSYNYDWKIVSPNSGNASISDATTLFPVLTAQTDNENDLIIRFIAINSSTGCADSIESIFTVGVVPVFASGEPSDLTTCENIEGTLIGTFNLTNAVTTVIPIDATITYHTSASDAENGIGSLPTPESYTATNGEVVYIRLENNGCFVTDDIILTVIGLPVIMIDPVSTQCENGDPILLSATPTGGVFSGAGVGGNMFDPSVAGVGIHIITYTVTVGGCMNSGTINIEVVETLNTVINTNDSGPGSLRAIIENPCVGDTVFFDTALLGSLISLTSGEIMITEDKVLLGLDMEMLTISGSFSSRIFNVQTGINFQIIEVTLKDGFSLTQGGSILNGGNTTLRDVKIENSFENTTPKALTNLPSAELIIQGDVIVKE
jgi:hypothetical protein